MAEGNIQRVSSGLSDEGSLTFEDAEDNDNFLSPTNPPPGAFSPPIDEASGDGGDTAHENEATIHSDDGAPAAEPATVEEEHTASAAAINAPELTQGGNGEGSVPVGGAALSSPGAPHDQGEEGVRQEDAQQVLAEEEQEEREAAEQAAAMAEAAARGVILVKDLATGKLVNMEEMDQCNSFQGLQEENARKQAELDMMARQRSNSFVPTHAVPEEVEVCRKTHQELTDLYLQQELRSHTGAVWCMKFSRDGTFLGTGGDDGVVRCWVVAGLAEGSSSTSRPVFEHLPYREYEGHKKEVLKLAWSAGNFLLSSSMDKTVRLWHILRTECLAVFRHAGNVTAIEFHPRDERYFLSASYQEMRLRLFNIPEKRCMNWAPTNVAPTAACFTSDGKSIVVGCSNGMCKFFAADGLRFVNEIDAVAGNRARAEDRKKVTGLEWAAGHLLVTTNDSRIRRFDMRDFSLVCKYTGFTNTDIPLYATLSEQGEFIVCGSENNCVYVWNTTNKYEGGWFGGGSASRNESYECYEAHGAMVTSTCWAPFAVRGLVAEGPEFLQGQIILSADYDGKIKIYEVRGAPKEA